MAGVNRFFSGEIKLDSQAARVSSVSRSLALITSAGLWSGATAYAVVTARTLYADTAWILLSILANPGRFLEWDSYRAFVGLIYQAPVLLGQRLGVNAVSIYAALYSIGTLVVPTVAFLLALYIVRRQFILFSIIGFAATVFGFGVNFINSEANVMFAFVWLSVAVLALEREAPMLRGLLLPGLAFALIRSYEGMLMAGPILAAWAFMLAVRCRGQVDRIGLVLTSFLFLLGAAAGFGGFIAPRDPANLGLFAGSLFDYLKNPQVLLLFSGLAAVVAVLTKGRWKRLLCVATSAVLGGVFLVWIIRLDWFGVYYYNRAFLAILLPVVLMLLFLVWWLRPAWLASRQSASTSVVFLVPFAFAVAGDVVGTYRWSQDIEKFCKVLGTDLSPDDRFEALRGSALRTAWSWTYPSMAILLRDRGSSAMISNPPDTPWQPFSLDKAPSIPHKGLCEARLFRSQ